MYTRIAAARLVTNGNGTRLRLTAGNSRITRFFPGLISSHTCDNFISLVGEDAQCEFIRSLTKETQDVLHYIHEELYFIEEALNSFLGVLYRVEESHLYQRLLSKHNLFHSRKFLFLLDPSTLLLYLWSSHDRWIFKRLDLSFSSKP